LSAAVDAVENTGDKPSGEQRVVMERLRKEGAEWKQRAKEAELAIKKYGKDVGVTAVVAFKIRRCTASDVATLEEVKKAKDLEIEKYKKYLNKAKKIIENFGESKSQSPDDSLEVNQLVPA